MLKYLFARESAQKKPELPRHIKYVTYRIDNPQVAKALFEWHMQHTIATKEIEGFIRHNFQANPFGTNQLLYKLDSNGHLNSVSYAGLYPNGWKGIPGTHWLEPKDDEAIREVQSLPQPPSMEKLHELIDWPSLDPKWFHKDEHDTIQFINHMAKPYGDGQTTYIDVPHPDNFKAFPRIYNIIKDWNKPEWLTENTAHKESTPKP